MSNLTVLVSSGSTEGSGELENGDIIYVGSDRWYAWLRENGSFRFESGFAGKNSFTARKHERPTGDFWYAYRKLEGKTRSLYLGKSEALTVERMLDVADRLIQPSEPKSNGHKLVTEANRLGTALEEIEQLRSQLAELSGEVRSLRTDRARAGSILKEALKIKAGNGGAIKMEIRKAFPELAK